MNDAILRLQTLLAFGRRVIEVQSFIDGLPEGPVKSGLQTRLNAILADVP